jgi:hypothetical protein
LIEKKPVEGCSTLENFMDQTLIDQIIKRAVDLLLEKMIAAAPKQRVLMLFSGAGTGYVVGLQAIQWLAKAGHPLTVIMTASARHVIGEENVRKAGAVHLIGDNEWVNTPKFVRESDILLLPTLSMNTAAHLALGLMDSLITTLTLGSLLAGKPVIAVCDGANPYGNGGRVFSDSNDTAPRLRARLADNLTALMDYGIQLVAEEAFLFSLVNQLHGATAQAPIAQPASIKASPIGAAPKTIFTSSPGEMLTAGELLGYPSGSTIRLAPGTRLTPLAQEAVFRQELKLVYE